MESASLVHLLIYSLCLVPFLCASAFFSGTETAFFSLNSLERENLRLQAGSRWKRYLRRIFTQSDSLLVTILTGNMLVNVFATDFFASTITDELAGLLHIPQGGPFSWIELPELFSIVSMTFLILIFGEMTPKNLAVRHPVAFARYALFPLYIAERLFKPFTSLLTFFQTRLMRSLSRRINEKEDLKNELLSLTVQIGYREKMLNKFEFDLFESYLEFSRKTASDVLVPRTALQGIDISTTISELLGRVAQHAGSRSDPTIYVYQGDLDHILGYLNLRDLLPYKYGQASGEDLRLVLKPFYVVPESKPLTDLIGELRSRNIELAQVVDEYGGTAGILSFQHLVEDVFDYFYESADEIMKLADGWYRVAGTTELERIQDLCEVEFASEARTVSGLLLEQLGEIPEAGRQVTIQRVDFLVKKATTRKILLLELRKR